MQEFKSRRSEGCIQRMNLSTRLKHTCAIVCCLFAMISIVQSQDAHYWQFQFGSKSTLLGGAVIGSVSDISAVFYNPGALGVIDDPAFTVSANVIEFSTVRLVDDAGRGINLGTSSTGLRPSLIAGTLSEDLFGGGGRLAYSGLTRQSGSSDLQGIITNEDMDIFPEFEFDDIAANARFDGRYNDLWLGLTYAHPISNSFGIGISWYNALRSQRQRTETTVQGINDGNGGASTSFSVSGGDYYAARMVFKVGANWVFDRFSAGITMTTPGLHLLGKGSLNLNESYTDPDSSALAANTQTKIKAKYKSPLSVGAGFGYKFDKLHVHVSAEWYASIPEYEVMRGTSWESQQPAGEVREAVSLHQQGSIVNWGTGVEYIMKETLSLYGSYYIDNSVRDDVTVRADLTTSPININNINIGSDFKLGNLRLDLGLGFAWGTEPNEQLNELIRGANRDIEVSYLYRSFRILFGIEIGRK